MTDNTLFYYIAGSKILCNNCSDEDILCIQKDDFSKTIRENGVDIFHRPINEFRRELEFNSIDIKYSYRELYAIGFALTKKKGLIVGEMPDDIKNYNWFDYRDNVVERCIKECNSYALNPRMHNTKNRDMCLKHTYWIFANYFALVNNSLDFTAEQLDIIQKCHDNELPRSYAEEVYQKLLEMLPAQEQEQATISYEELVDSKIRARYTISQEFAILRQRDTKPDEFAEYNAYCEQCKAEAKAELGL